MSGPTPPRHGEPAGRPGDALLLPEGPLRDIHDVIGQLIGTVPIPQATFDLLVAVAVHVSYGRSAAFSVGPYPDSTARVALGALHDAGLLDAYRQRHPEAGE